MPASLEGSTWLRSSKLLEVIEGRSVGQSVTPAAPLVRFIRIGHQNNHVSRRFKYYVRLAKLPERTRFHSLRHTCASWLVQRGVSLPIVQAILGHSTIRVPQRYAHLAPDVMQAAMQEAFGGG